MDTVRGLLCGLWNAGSCGLCGLSAVVPLAAVARQAGTTQRPVLPALQGCLRGSSDVELFGMASAVRPMLLALEVLGAWTFVAVREMNANLAKVEESAVVDAFADGSELLLSAVLDGEVKAGIHGAGGLVADGSANSA